jgi:hypothetical protein
MRRLAAAAGLALPALAPQAAAALPACTESQGGNLVATDISDPYNPLADLTRYYATHRLIFTLRADNGSPEDPDGTRYSIEGGSERLVQAPGVVASTSYIGDTPGIKELLVNWTVNKAKPTETRTPFCTATKPFAFGLARPTRTSFQVKRSLTEPTGADPRLRVNIAGGKTEDLRPLDVRVRRGSRGRRKTLFTIPLADVSVPKGPGVRRFRFKRRFAGMTISVAPRNVSVETRGLVTLGVKMPKVRDKRRVRRSFTLELARGKRTLLRVRAVISCRGLGRAPAFQICKTPVFRVKRPASSVLERTPSLR